MRWIVDAMNVIGSRPDGWWRDRDAAMARLVDRLERWSARTGNDVTVVFERRPSPPVTSPLVEIAGAPKPRRDAADDEIVAHGRAPTRARLRSGGHLDNLLTDLVHAAGATVEPAARFRDEIESG